MNDSRRRARARATGWGIYAILGLLASAAIHVGTYVGRPLSPNNPVFFVLHLGLFVSGVALVLKSRKWQPEVTGAFGGRVRQLDWRQWRPFLPGWAPRAILVLGAYYLATFLFAVLHLPSRGSQELSSAQAMYMVRMFSAGWSLAYGLPALYFTYAPQDHARGSAPRNAAT